jgi:hypothetical protein
MENIEISSGEAVVDIPKVIQNSDYLYKSDIKWNSDIEYIEPNQFEKDMLKGTKTAKELIEEEYEELNKIKILTDEEKLIQKKKNYLTMFQIIALNRLNLNILLDVSKLQKEQKESFKLHVNNLIEDYHNGFEEDIEKQFNKICNEKLFNCGNDVSNYPIYS